MNPWRGLTTACARRDTARQNAERASHGEIVMKVPPTRIRRPPANQLTLRYAYTVKVQNTGGRTVRLVEWAYVFTDPSTRKEVGLHRYTTKVKIGPGKSKELKGFSTAPPVLIAEAGAASGGAKQRLNEEVFITRIEYEGGEPWVRPQR